MRALKGLGPLVSPRRTLFLLALTGLGGLQVQIIRMEWRECPGGERRGADNAKLPGAYIYQGGAEMRLTPKMTFVADFFGERVTADRVLSKSFIAANGQAFPAIAFQKSAYSLMSGSTGFKINPMGNPIVTVNALFRLNHAELHGNAVPMIGISYTL